MHSPGKQRPEYVSEETRKSISSMATSFPDSVTPPIAIINKTTELCDAINEKPYLVQVISS